MIKDEVLYKSLKTKLAQLNEEMRIIRKEISEKTKESNKLFKEIDDIQKRMESLREANIILSEHAILRYLERSDALNREELYNKILSKKNKEAINALGDGKYPMNDGSGLSLIVKGNVITTIVKKGK